jgi:hypothetical protein
LVDQHGNTEAIEPSLLNGKTTSIDQYGRTRLVAAYSSTASALPNSSWLTGKSKSIDQYRGLISVDVSLITAQPKLATPADLAGKTISVNRNGQTFLVDSQPRQVTLPGGDESNGSTDALSENDGAIARPGQSHQGRRKKNGAVMLVGPVVWTHCAWIVVGFVVLL